MRTDKPIVILGAGRHTAVLVEALTALGREVQGVVAPGPDVADSGLPYLGTDEDLLVRDPGGLEVVCGVGSVRGPKVRTALIARYRANGFTFASVVHPKAHIAESVRIGGGVQVLAGAIVSTEAALGQDVLINTGAIVDHDCIIGDYSHIATGARLAGEVKVGPRCHIGAGATIIQGVTIGADVVVGAGAVVIRDVPSGSTVVGVPARPLAVTE